MHLFLAGQGPAPIDLDRARAALAGLIEQLPFFAAETLVQWHGAGGRVGWVSVATEPSRTGGVHYRCVEEGQSALFAGRPIRWGAGGGADGRGAVDAARYLRPDSERWADELDGRGTVVRAGAHGLELFADALGAYPLYEASAPDGGRWFSNNADALRRLCGQGGVDEQVLASVLAGGWSLGGHPVWRAVRRVPRGTLVSAEPDGREHRRELLPLAEIVRMAGGPLDAAAAAADLIELTAALADWPGRPNVVPLTGGRDSRVIFAAARHAGFSFAAATGGAPGDPDVRVAAALCERVGMTHELLEADPHGDRFGDPQRAARITHLVSGGTATLADGAGFPLGPRAGALPLWHSGQGGEIARSYYGPGGPGVAAHLYRRLSGRRPGRRAPVSAEAERAVRGQIDAFVAQVRGAGARTADVGDLFYLLERMACWAAPAHGAVELIRDTTSPLWSRRLLPALLALPARRRALEGFHHRVLEQLDPRLLGVPFQDGETWPPPRHYAEVRIEHARRLAAKGRAELARRAAARVSVRRGTGGGTAVPASAPGGSPAPVDRFAAMSALVLEVATSQPAHPAWTVLDRPRVEALLRSPPASLDEMSRAYAWRLASVFLGLP
ncbi:MAG TPA: hypothetical protein VHX88_07700 [Solirubrobacteraceae bacterium]|jgi:hypothetical protein|nr:hypothetical protein [Solirubrobacteraceae bacterium]